MTVSKAVVVACDGLVVEGRGTLSDAKRCVNTFTWLASESRDVVIHKAKNDGWTTAAHEAWHYCPACPDRLGAR